VIAVTTLNATIVRGIVVVGALVCAACAVASCGSFAAAEAPSGEGGADGPGASADGASEAASDDGGAGSPIMVLAQGFADLAGITATESMVYFTERTAGNVRVVPLEGGAATSLKVTGGAPSGIVVAADQLFWVEYGQDRISRMPLLGGASTSFSPTPGKRSFNIAAAVDRVVTVAVGVDDIGEIQQYDFGFGIGPSVGGQQNPFDVAVAGNDVFWTESNAARVRRGHLGDASSTEIASGETDCESIAADALGVYWTRPLPGLLRTIPSGSSVAETIATGETGARSLATDGAALYWITDDGQIRKLGHGPRPSVETLASGFMAIADSSRLQTLALTSRYVVWLTADGRVLRHAK
jgi:hypothetical protein